MGIRYSVCCHCRHTISFFPSPPDGLTCANCGVHNSAETIMNTNSVLENEYHTRRTKRMKCITHNCSNHSDQGRFIGDLCSPCHQFITTGRGEHSQLYRNAVNSFRINQLSKMIKMSIIDIQSVYDGDSTYQSKLSDMVSAYMTYIGSDDHKMYKDFEVVCDARNNPPSEVDANRLNIYISINCPSKELIESLETNNIPFRYTN